MPHIPVEPKKKKQPTKTTAPKPDTHAPTSDNPVNLVTFSFDHQPTSFKSKNQDLEKKK